MKEQEQNLKNYFKPRSLTWWTGLSSIGMGLSQVIGVSNDFLGVFGDVIVRLTGGSDASPAGLIALGAGLIGIRAKMDRMPVETVVSAQESLAIEPSPADIAMYEQESVEEE